MTVNQNDDRVTAWSELRPVESRAGEARANLIRLFAILAFYSYYLISVFIAGDVDQQFFLFVSTISLLWFISVIVVYLRLQKESIPEWFRYLTTAWDIALISALLMIGDTPQSALISLFFVVIAMSALRWDIRLIWATTLGSILGYLAAISYYVTVEIGVDTYYSDPAGRIPRREEAITILALVAAGFVAGQVVRQIKRALVYVTLAPERHSQEDKTENHDDR